ncbi:nicotinate-nucleotide pyrophosphorylase [carboxylating] [Ambystoma mexicanum]|uniref:nicotinate-nucleotide pyrophosphorylase [carboxylating] n=1 Tax=Ambystoma mexicanum TaxID=8296 RepID=UPI0037E8C673
MLPGSRLLKVRCINLLVVGFLRAQLKVEREAQGTMATPRPDLCNLLHPVILGQLARDWLQEDVPAFDYGGFVVGEREECAVLLCKSPGVLAGVPFFDAVFHELGCAVEWTHTEGTWLEPVTRVALVRGKVRHLLLGERVALNCLARCSGIATAAWKVVSQAKDTQWHGQVAGTRKTTPGFRLVEKYAMLVGGASTHRYDLSSLVMLKDNHIWSAGNITQAVEDAKRVAGFSLKIEVECRSIKEAREAAQAGADIVMLDNFQAQEVHTVAQLLKSEFPRLTVEASGGISEENVTQFFSPHVDVVSLGALTQAFQVVDFSLKITRGEGEDASGNSNNNNSVPATCETMPAPATSSIISSSIPETPGRRKFAF